MSVSRPPPVLLYVEDEVLIQDLVGGALRDAGFEVELALTGSIALDVMTDRATRFDALITDVNLPRGPDGWAVARRARELFSQIPVLYVTGDSAHDWASKGVPGSHVLTKPFQPQELVLAVASMLRRSSEETPA